MKYVVKLEVKNVAAIRNCVTLLRQLKDVLTVECTSPQTPPVQRPRSWDISLPRRTWVLACNYGYILQVTRDRNQLSYYQLEVNVEQARIKKNFTQFVKAIRQYIPNITALQAQELANEALLK